MTNSLRLESHPLYKPPLTSRVTNTYPCHMSATSAVGVRVSNPMHGTWFAPLRHSPTGFNTNITITTITSPLSTPMRIHLQSFQSSPKRKSHEDVALLPSSTNLPPASIPLRNPDAVKLVHIGQPRLLFLDMDDSRDELLAAST